MLIVWFVVLIVFSVLCGKLSEVPDSSKVSITSHMWVRLGTSWIGAHVPTTPFFGKCDIAEWVGCARTVTKSGSI
jgi:hypothetical protein